MTNSSDHSNWLSFASCNRLWDWDSRMEYRGMWRMGTSATADALFFVVGVPYSIFS